MVAQAASGESHVLSRVISTIASRLELDAVLSAVVELLSDASAVHACFVYLAEDGGERLVLRAASRPYAHLVGSIVLERGEGLAWWAAERGEPAFVRDELLSDPRTKYVPELEEERFQSLICVPILAKDGSPVGVVSMHSEAPREFSEDEVEFLVSTSTLLGGAVETARLYRDMGRRVEDLERLTTLGEAVARAETLDGLAEAVVAGCRDLLRADWCRLYVLEGASALRLRAAAPAAPDAPAFLEPTRLGPQLSRSGGTPSIGIRVLAGDELLGFLQAGGTSDVDLGRAVAHQTALAVEKIRLIERLTERNLIKDFFEELSGGRLDAGLSGRARRLGVDLDVPHLVVVGRPPSDELERLVASVAPGAALDRRDDSVRALLPVPAGGEAAVLEALRRGHGRLSGPALIGVSSACRGAASFAAGFEEARHALLGAAVLDGRPVVTQYDELGPYKYLLRMSLDSSLRDAHREAVERLVAYDEARSSSLLRTLEELLRRRGNISATADALHVHQNTLRQRLRRIMQVSGLDLMKDDWLMVEIAVKLVRLRQALGTGDPPPA
jgi:sugar diacid utilization regulator/putative methionine-R-sulfoxide reductase with GAF domain